MKEQKHSDRSHAKFSPSSSHRWMNCPASVKLSENAPPQIEGPHAREGTLAHECLEFIMKRATRLSTATINAATAKWDEEKVRHALTAAKQILELKPSPTAKLLIETKARVDDDVNGTLDYAWVDEWGKLIVIDYKYGQGVAVSPVDENGEENSQLMCYAAGIAIAHEFEFDSVELVIIQPRTDDEPKKHQTTVKRVREFALKAKASVLAAKGKEPKACAGDWCRWCPAATFCPEISENQMRNADIFFDGGVVEATPEPGQLTTETLGKYLVACDLLETWIDKVRERAFELAKAGEKIPGRKLVQKRSTRVWIDSDKAQKEAVANWGVGLTMKYELLSPAQLEKSVGKEAKAFTDKWTSSVSSGVTLVPESDKRPEVTDVTLFDV